MTKGLTGCLTPQSPVWLCCGPIIFSRYTQEVSQISMYLEAPSIVRLWCGLPKERSRLPIATERWTVELTKLWESRESMHPLSVVARVSMPAGIFVGHVSSAQGRPIPDGMGMREENMIRQVCPLDLIIAKIVPARSIEDQLGPGCVYTTQ